MKIRLDYNNMMQDFVGKTGVNKADIDALNLDKAKQAMIDKRANGKMDWRDLPYNQEEVCDEIISYVQEVKDKFDAFVVLGIGGSALGPISVQQAINHPYYNEISREKRGGYPRFYVADNVDPEKLVYLFETID